MQVSALPFSLRSPFGSPFFHPAPIANTGHFSRTPFSQRSFNRIQSAMLTLSTPPFTTFHLSSPSFSQDTFTALLVRNHPTCMGKRSLASFQISLQHFSKTLPFDTRTQNISIRLSPFTQFQHSFSDTLFRLSPTTKQLSLIRTPFCTHPDFQFNTS